VEKPDLSPFDMQLAFGIPSWRLTSSA